MQQYITVFQVSAYYRREFLDCVHLWRRRKKMAKRELGWGGVFWAGMEFWSIHAHTDAIVKHHVDTDDALTYLLT